MPFFQEYVNSNKHGRNLDNTNILEIKQGFEPLNFTGYFFEWDPSKWDVRLVFFLPVIKFQLVRETYIS